MAHTIKGEITPPNNVAHPWANSAGGARVSVRSAKATGIHPAKSIPMDHTKYIRGGKIAQPC